MAVSNDPGMTLDKAISGMRDEYIRCRDMSHSWRPFHIAVLDHCYDQQLRCTRCYTIKHREVSFTGHLLSVHYEYCDGYVVKGLGRLTGEDRDQLRLESVQRTLRTGSGKEQKTQGG